MKKIKSALLGCLFTFLIPLLAHTQDSDCENLNFERGNFTNWVGYTWIYSDGVQGINTSPRAGIVNRRHAIMSDTTAYDANTGYMLKKVPAGYSYSARLGDEIISTDEKPRCWQQSLQYTMTIDSTNALLVIKFALVFQYDSDHTATNEPRFRFTIYDEHGDTIPDCSNYDVFASNRNVKGFETYITDKYEEPIIWRDWTTVGADLSKYTGQSITIEFMSADCTQWFDFGYAYFVAECHPLYITMHYCAGDSVATMIAPEGFENYNWTDDSAAVVDTVQILRIADPTEGATYTCTMTSATGCTVALQSTIVKYILHDEFISNMIDCNSNTVQLVNLSTTTHGTLLYRWDFGDGNTSAEKDPRYTFSTSGMHKVGLFLSNPPSTCVDSLIKDVESFSPPLVGIEGYSTYCPGQSVVLKAYGAADYTWNNGSKADTVEITAPGGDFWLLGRSDTLECVSDTIRRTITEEPDWNFSAEGDTSLCTGDSSILSANGAVDYFWNTGDTLSTITVSTPGVYTIVGANKRGCRKSESFNVLEHPLPEADFTLSGNPLDSRHNLITCSLPAQDNVSYFWDMGDGTTETGSTIQHSYSISGSVLYYTITLLATSQFECQSTSDEIVDVVPFVPNVFTPNGDGINDVFMPNLELEIFDRNGLVLYSGNTGWDGNYNGRSADPDTYFYILYYSDRNAMQHSKKGYVTLVR
jgi:gliding motility-associated-like protein